MGWDTYGEKIILCFIGRVDFVEILNAVESMTKNSDGDWTAVNKDVKSLPSVDLHYDRRVSVKIERIIRKLTSEGYEVREVGCTWGRKFEISLKK